MSSLVALSALALILYNATFVDRQPPTVYRTYLSATVPGNDRLAQTVTAINVEFSEPVKPETAESRFHLQPAVAGTFTWEASRLLVFTPSTPLPVGTTFTLTVDPGVEDLAGNGLTEKLDRWKFDTAGLPVVSAVTPADGSTNVPVDTSVTLDFDRLMDTDSVARALTILPAAPHSLQWSGRRLTINFAVPLAFGTRYSVTVADTASDTSGEQLQGAFTTRFATVPSGLSRTLSVPVAGVSGVSVTSPIAVVFDRPIDPASVTGAIHLVPDISGTIRVTSLPDDTTATVVGGALPSSAGLILGGSAGGVLVFTPNGKFDPNTTYTVTLDPAVRALGGDGGIAPGATWSFTTGGPSDSLQNQVAFLSMRSGVRNVWAMNPDGTNQRQGTSELVPVSSFDVSADGRTIVYASGGVLKSAGANGSNVRTLTASGSFEYAPKITPDGASVIAARRGSDGTDLGWWLIGLPGEGKEGQRQLTGDGAPRLGSVELEGDGLTADGSLSAWEPRLATDRAVTTMLVIGDANRPMLVRIAAASSGYPRLALTAVSAPVWDTKLNAFLLVATSEKEPTPGLWRVALDGAMTRIADAAGSVAVTSGGAAAWLHSDAGVLHLAYVATVTGEPAVLTTATDLADRGPAFAPDSSRILFVRVAVGALEKSAGIWSVGLDGRELRQLTADGVAIHWLP